MYKLVLALVGVMPLVCALPAYGAAGTTCHEGDGVFAQERRPLSGFREVSINGAFEVKIRPGLSASMTLEGDANLLQYVMSTVSNGILQVFVKESICSKIPLRLILESPPFASLEIDGAGALKAHIKAQQFIVLAHGTYDLRFQGEVDELSVTADGTASVNALDLQAVHVKAKVNETADISVSAEKSLVVQCADAGSVIYKGNPSSTKLQAYDICEIRNIDKP